MYPVVWGVSLVRPRTEKWCWLHGCCLTWANIVKPDRTESGRSAVRSRPAHRSEQRRCPRLIADEPAGNLDSTTGAERGITIILGTHDEALAARCDRIIHVHVGYVVPTFGAA